MENLKYSLFDLFAYTIPGVIELVLIFILFHHNATGTSVSNPLTEMAAGANVYSATLFIGVSYFVGYISGQISGWYMKIFKRFRYFRPAAPAKKKLLSNSAKYVLVRELSKENMKYIEIWNVMKTLSSNCSFMAFIFSILFFINYYQIKSVPELLLCTGSGCIVSVMLAKESCKYEEWRTIDLDNCIDQFKLDSSPETLLKRT